jgi:DNA-binding MarR family transcriptional regulator
MRIGNDERIVFTLLENYPFLTKTNLQILFTLMTNKKRDTGKILQSLTIKGFLDENSHPIKNDSIKNDYMSSKIQIDETTLANIKNIDEFIKLGKNAKSILYILFQIKKSSLQFLADLLGESVRNIYAILQRLEEKNLVYSYNSKIYHLNTRGRRFNPKYYVITDIGKLVAKIKMDNKIDYDKIDVLLEKTKAEIDSMHKIFNTSNT